MLQRPTELSGTTQATRELQNTEREWLSTSYTFRARAGRRYRLRQLASLVQSSAHHEPDRQAIRLASAARKYGFDDVRDANRRAWERLWRGRVRLIGAPRRWQALADAAVFYLHSSAHPSSPASTSMFGLSYWPNYHYYRGHVMWDIETFALPPLLLLEPAAARALLDFRAERLPGACQNAALSGFSGAQFPWESSMRYGDEATPDEGDASAVEHHVSIDVSHAFAQYVHATGDLDYASRRAWPVISAVADWIESRATETGRGYEIQRVTGIAEKERPENNSAFTNIGAIVVLREALALAERLGTHPARSWSEIARRLVVPLDRRSSIIRNYDGHRASDEKGRRPTLQQRSCSSATTHRQGWRWRPTDGRSNSQMGTSALQCSPRFSVSLPRGSETGSRLSTFLNGATRSSPSIHLTRPTSTAPRSFQSNPEPRHSPRTSAGSFSDCSTG